MEPVLGSRCCLQGALGLVPAEYMISAQEADHNNFHGEVGWAVLPVSDIWALGRSSMCLVPGWKVPLSSQAWEEAKSLPALGPPAKTSLSLKRNSTARPGERSLWVQHSCRTRDILVWAEVVAQSRRCKPWGTWWGSARFG